MKNNENNSSSKVVYAVLGLSLLGQGTYIYKQAGDTNEIKQQIEDSNKERSQILVELTKLNSSRDSILNQNTIISKELELERQKVVNMIDELSKSKRQVKQLQNSLFAYKELERNNEIAKNVFQNNNSTSNAFAANNKIKAKADLASKREILKRKKDSLDAKIKSDKSEILAELKRKSDALKAKKDSIDRKIKTDNERLLVELKKNNADLKEKQVQKEKEIAEQNYILKEKQVQKEKELATQNAFLKEKQILKDKEIAEQNAALKEKQVIKELADQKAILKEKQDKNEAQNTNSSEDNFLAKEKNAIIESAKINELARLKKVNAEKERYAAAQAIANQAKKDADAKKEAAAKSIEAAKKVEVVPVKKEDVLNPNEIRLGVDEKTKSIKKLENVDKLTKINIKELKSIGIKAATEDEEEQETVLAADVNVLRVSFTIPQNFVVRASERNYFIQVIDSKGNMVGENATVIFEDDSRLAYTFSTKVKYKNKAINVVENMYYKNFKKGNYTVRVYDKSNLVSESNLILR